MRDDIFEALNERNKAKSRFVLFNAFEMKEANMVCEGIFDGWYELMGYIHGRHSGSIRYSVEEKILDYYIEIELSYYACDADPNHLRIPGELVPFAKYRVYIC